MPPYPRASDGRPSACRRCGAHAAFFAFFFGLPPPLAVGSLSSLSSLSSGSASRFSPFPGASPPAPL
eukprot:CAMPEP_0171181268 /NCGR_PEP_ID=MMETSP0790-20130122/14174_1 /TAXON_ID=2925 /ORGANISM="Alexandrium catenella, Strain OF101" /LENGTH=66 /DNA_ID=CAMNT_0011646205 /DNA_START=17 /DNA_END=214 /DNA_ORIENTATION=+